MREGLLVDLNHSRGGLQVREGYITYIGILIPPSSGLFRLKVVAVRVLTVEVAILSSELTILDLFVAELFTHRVSPPPRGVQAKVKSVYQA